MKSFRRSSFNVAKPIKVVFVGEPSEDASGPMREFFTLLMQHMITSSGLFEESPGGAVLAHNSLALQQMDFEIVGKMIASSICHGGPAPHCFSCALAEMIVYGRVQSDTSIEDIPDQSVRDSLQKVSFK